VAIGALQTEADLERFIEDRVQQRLTSQQGQVASAQVQVQGLVDGLPARLARGEVSSAGTVVRGSGWSVAHGSLGHFVVSDATAFPVTPVVVATIGPTAYGSLRVLTTSASAFEVETYNPAASANVDLAFTFLAVAV
jgi:hypothetical protein